MNKVTKPVFQKVKAKDLTGWLKEQEDLTRRNRGGGVFQGYETSSNTPMYVEGKVNNASGLGDVASVLANAPRTVAPVESVPVEDPNDQYANVDPAYEVRDTIEYLQNLDLNSLTPEQLENVKQTIKEVDQILGRQQTTFDESVNLQTPNTELQKQRQLETFTPPRPPVLDTTSLESNTPRLPPSMQGTGDADTMWNSGWNAGFNNPNSNYDGSDPNVKAGFLKGQQEYFARQESLGTQDLLSKSETQNNMADTLSGEVKPLETNWAEKEYENLKANDPQKLQKLASAGIRNKFDIIQQKQQGITPEQQAEQNSIDLPTVSKPPQPVSEKMGVGEGSGVRQILGNLASLIGDKAGIPEMGISEMIAGGKTKDYNKTYAAEPDVSLAELPQAGAGLDILKGQSNNLPIIDKTSTRPPIEGMNPMMAVGASPVGGLQSKAPGAPSATSINPAMIAPVQVQSGAQSRPTNMGQTMSNTVNQQQSSNNQSRPSSSQSNNNQSNNNNQNKSQSSYSAPKPAPTPTKSTYSAPKPVYNMPQPAPPKATPAPTPQRPSAPAPQPSKPSVVQQISSWISNLFKRK